MSVTVEELLRDQRELERAYYKHLGKFIKLREVAADHHDESCACAGDFCELGAVLAETSYLEQKVAA